MGLAPFRLKPWFSERVWGKRDLRPWYVDTGTSELVGEAWLTGPECVVETGVFAGRTFASIAGELGGEFPLLVKLLLLKKQLLNLQQKKQLPKLQKKFNNQGIFSGSSKILPVRLSLWYDEQGGFLFNRQGPEDIWIQRRSNDFTR